MKKIFYKANMPLFGPCFHKKKNEWTMKMEEKLYESWKNHETERE